MKRLDVIVDYLKGYETLLDIGTDHGYTILKAFEKGYIKKAIATDLRSKPLEVAKKNLNDFPVEYIQSDGFLNVTNKNYDVVVISGMGSSLICEILEKRPNKDITYILQPNDKVEVLRSYLSNNNLKIVDESVVFDKFYYVILKVEIGMEILSNEDIYLGPVLKLKTSSYNYYLNKLDILLNIYQKSKDDSHLKNIKLLENVTARLKVK